MRLPRLVALVLLVACSSGRSTLPQPPTAPPAGSPATARDAPRLPQAEKAAPAAERAAVPPGAIRLADLDPHRAALFLSNVFRTDVIVAGGTADPTTLGIQSETAEGAFQELADASTLSMRAEEGVFWLGPPEALAHRAPSGLRGGRPVDVFFYRADAAGIVRILEEADHISLEGALTGTASIALRNVGARRALGMLVRLAGQEAQVRGSTITLSGPTALPPTHGSAGAPDGPCQAETALERHVDLPCVPLAALEVCGTATVGHGPVALVRRRGAGPDSAHAAEARQGSLLGNPATRVASVDTDGVVLEDGTRIPLGGGGH